MLCLKNLNTVKSHLSKCKLSLFENEDNGYKKFIKSLFIEKFRHIENLHMEFSHPITVISGQNKIGKTSLLLLIACSHENFLKLDATNPEPTIRKHEWKDVLRFTKHDEISSSIENYIYRMEWRIGTKNSKGEGRRGICGKKPSWTGLAKKSSENRENAKIKDFQVRLIDLERILPARNFTRRLQTKANKIIPSDRERLNSDIEQAFSYIFDLVDVKIYNIGAHINKRCYLINKDGKQYTSYATASGEDAIINILVDIFDSPKNTLILIDELEAGFHPYIQRRLADIIQYVSWHHKKQFIITTHSPTIMSSFEKESRRFIEKKNEIYKTIQKVSLPAVFSKMDIFAHPLMRLYCEDNLAKYIISQVIIEIEKNHPAFSKLINIIISGSSDKVMNDYECHKKNFSQMIPKIGFCCIFDGDVRDNKNYIKYRESSEHSFFIYPYEAPEKFLAKSYLKVNSDAVLSSSLEHLNHHSFFKEMVATGKATDEANAREKCFSLFSTTNEYNKLKDDLMNFLIHKLTYFSEEIE